MTQHLVTGGAGFIGSHLVKALQSQSIPPIVVDRRPMHESPILRGITKEMNFMQVDLRDSVKTAELIAAVKPDIVYHLAAQPLSITSNVDPLGTAQDNILATYSLLEAVRKHAPYSRVVYASSACFYGVPTSQPPLRETDAPAVGHYIYTATKVAADFAVQHYRHIYGLQCMCARMVNVYGPGEMHFERIVPRLILHALEGRAPTLTQSDGSDILSFLYVDDAVAALRLLATHPISSKMAVWNVAGLAPLSILELMKVIYRLVGRPTESFAAVGPRRGAPVHKYLDGAAIKREFGFSPSVDLGHGVSLTIDWYRQYLDGARSRQEEVLDARV